MKKEELIKLAEKVYNGSASDEELMQYNLHYNKLRQEEENSDSLNPAELEERGFLIYNRLERELANNSRIVSIKRRKRTYAALYAVASILAFAAIGFWFYKGTTTTNFKVKQVITKASGSENTMVTLPDGSTVILGVGSKMNYSSDFIKGHLREVTLSGKGFFDIKHDSSRPFIVHTGDVHTTVLGTAFDIQAYPGSSDVTVRVIRGKVSVTRKDRMLGILTPDKQVVYNHREDQAVVSAVDAGKAMNWREKDLMFNDVTFAEAGGLLEERFDMKINISDGKLAARHFTTTLYEKQALSEFLSLICDFNGATFTIDSQNRNVTIDPVK